jgi:transposase
VHLNSVRGWMNRWRSAGLVGLHEERPVGRPRKLSPAVADRLRQIVLTEGGTVRHIMQCMEEQQMPLLAEPATVSRWRKEMGFSYKRYRTSLKKAGRRSGGVLRPATRHAKTAGAGRDAGAVLF